MPSISGNYVSLTWLVLGILSFILCLDLANHSNLLSGPYHHDGPRMDHAPMSYNGPPREPAFPNNRWNFPPRSMNHRQFNPYRPPSGGPIPVSNRGLLSISIFCLFAIVLKMEYPPQDVVRLNCMSEIILFGI